MIFKALILLVAMISAITAQLTASQQAFLRKGLSKRLRPDLRIIPRLVQMSFHDCVGGCDGCLDINGNSGNRGLQSTLDFARKFRNDFAPQLSMADVIALLGIETVKQTARFANGSVTIPYSIGRQDCDPSRGLPSRNLPHADVLDSIQILKDEFNLNDREAVALLGCHSLGGAHKDRSGFEGNWDSHPLQLDIGFFLNMASRDWETKTFQNEHVNSTAWTRPSSDFLMLHADMVMIKRFTLSGPLDTPSCTTISTCEASPTASIVFEFARSQPEFHRELGIAFRKMVDGNGVGLQLVS